MMRLPLYHPFMSIILGSLLFCAPASARKLEAQPPAPATLQPPATLKPDEPKWSFFYPYTPEKREYGFELGATYEENTMYWLGGHVGWHIDRCIFTESKTCQQYFDFVAGAAGREGLTIGYFFPALRWQYLHLPKAVSPSWRILAGLVTIQDDDRARSVFGYGLEYGWAVSVHPRADLRASIRFGFADEKPWAQLVFGIDPKINKYIDDVQTFGWESIRRGGSIIKKTIEAPVDFLQNPLDREVEPQPVAPPTKKTDPGG